MVGLGDLPGGAYESRRSAVSEDGSIVVGWSISASGSEAFRWSARDGMVGLGDLPGGRFSSEADGTSGDGSVVVGEASSAQGPEAFRWTRPEWLGWAICLAATFTARRMVSPPMDRWWSEGANPSPASKHFVGPKRKAW